MLHYFSQESWYREFGHVGKSRTTSLPAIESLALAATHEEEEEKVVALLASLHELIKDSQFVRLPTQNAMLAYALDNIAALDSVDRATLKDEIPEIHAKILARLG